MSRSNERTTESLVSQVISTWRGGHSPDAQRVLSQHPDLQQRKSLVLDLAYEEYCLRTEAGEQLAASTFCDRFPTFRRSLRRLIDVHEQFDQNPRDVGFALNDASWPEPGATLLEFELLEELGRGSLARVFLAAEPSLGRRKVVLKVSPHGGHEAETLGRLAHRNVVPVHSVRDDPATGTTAICMPYLGNATLHDVLDVGFADGSAPLRADVILQAARRGALLEAIPQEYVVEDRHLQRGAYVDGVVYLVAQLAEALSHAHRVGIYHHDLKPSNILLSPSGCPMLLDFNLSKDTAVGASMFGGTLPYMPPEQLREVILGSSDHQPPADPSWDVYSLGAILYELLTGSLPFGEKPPGTPELQAAAGLVESQLQGYAPARSRNPAVSAALDDLIERCLKFDPGQRPSSADALAEQLRTQLAPIQKLSRWLHRRRMLLIGTAAAVTALISTLSVGARLIWPSEEVRAYEAGVRAFESGRHAQAVEYFTKAHDAAPKAYQPLLARAQALAALGEFQNASNDLETAGSIHPLGISHAWSGYCLDRCQNPIAARYHYQKAMDDHGYVDVAVCNNLGNGYRRAGGLNRAAEYLSQAIDLDPQCQAAHHNRALVHARLAEDALGDRKLHGKAAMADILAAIELGAPNAGLYGDAALLFAKFGDEPGKAETVLGFMHQAIERGYDPVAIRKLEPLTPYVDARIRRAPGTPPIDHDLETLIAPPTFFPALTGAH